MCNVKRNIEFANKSEFLIFYSSMYDSNSKHQIGRHVREDIFLILKPLNEMNEYNIKFITDFIIQEHIIDTKVL